eukprot:2337782-Rhodomonas_salina.4
MCGTDLAFQATSSNGALSYGLSLTREGVCNLLQVPYYVSLQASYALSSTDVAYGANAICLQESYALSSTDMAMVL